VLEVLLWSTTATENDVSRREEVEAELAEVLIQCLTSPR
jgi:hypothetical protein